MSDWREHTPRVIPAPHRGMAIEGAIEGLRKAVAGLDHEADMDELVDVEFAANMLDGARRIHCKSYRGLERAFHRSITDAFTAAKAALETTKVPAGEVEDLRRQLVSELSQLASEQAFEAAAALVNR